MKIAIVGYGVDGQAVYDYYQKQPDTEVTILDQDVNLKAPSGAKTVLGDDYLSNLGEYDLIIRSPGLNPNLLLKPNPGIESKITTQIAEFLKTCPTKNVIGVTGTKGKGTTSTLIAKMLEANGKTVFLGGNIGTPPFTFMSKLTADSFVVLELSSFQLIDFKGTSPHIAVCLMVVPEHLNWHLDMAEYVTAKSNLFSHQTSDDIAIYFGDNDTSKQIASVSPGKHIPYYKEPGAAVVDGNIVIDNQVICGTNELKLLGLHNWQNICAAVTAVWQINQDVEPIKQVLTSFSGLEHRLEFVREINDLKFYNDSFGTTPETAMAAIEAFTQPEVVILGGQPKNVGFEALAEVVKANVNVKQVLVIGEASEEIAGALDSVGFKDYVRSEANTMPDIVKEADELAKKVKAESNEEVIVLLSTACTSFDMFKNYKERGELFKQAVLSLV